MMEINPANAFRIYGLPPRQLKVYLPKVFAKLAVPAEGDGILVETYVVSPRHYAGQLLFC